MEDNPLYQLMNSDHDQAEQGQEGTDADVDNYEEEQEEFENDAGKYPVDSKEPPAFTQERELQSDQTHPDVENMFQRLEETIRNGFEQRNPNTQQEETPPQPTEEEIEKLNEVLREKMLDNPLQFLDDYKRQIAGEFEQLLSERLKPYDEREQAMQQAHEEAENRRQMYENVENFRQSHPDYEDVLDSMTEFMDEHPDLQNNPKILQFAYNYAKSKAVDPSSDEYVKKATTDKRIQEEVIKQYLQGIKGEQPPQIITNAGEPPITSNQESPKTAKDASKLFKDKLRAQGLY